MGFITINKEDLHILKFLINNGLKESLKISKIKDNPYNLTPEKIRDICYRINMPIELK